MLSLWKPSCGKLCASPFFLHILRHIQHLICVYVLRHTHVDESYGNMMCLDLWVLTDLQIFWFRSLVSWEILDEEYVNKSSWAVLVVYIIQLLGDTWSGICFQILFKHGHLNSSFSWEIFDNEYVKLLNYGLDYLALNSFTKVMTCE